MQSWGMQPLGKALHLTSGGWLIVHCERLPPVPSRLYDGRHRPVGRVDELFGPWKTPFARVKLDQGSDSQRLLGRPVFTGD